GMSRSSRPAAQRARTVMSVAGAASLALPMASSRVLQDDDRCHLAQAGERNMAGERMTRLDLDERRLFPLADGTELARAAILEAAAGRGCAYRVIGGALG